MVAKASGYPNTIASVSGWYDARAPGTTIAPNTSMAGMASRTNRYHRNPTRHCT